MTDIKKFEPMWNSWYLDSLIGEGAFGKVYKLLRKQFGKTYFSAVKHISIPLFASEVKQLKGEGMDANSLASYYHKLVSELVREIEIMSKFKGNSNIVSLEDHMVVPKADGIGYDILIRMELLISLADFTLDKMLPYNEVIKLGIHICRALELFALENITHRDIKPGNIFISPYGDYKLGDFGVARQVERSTSGMTKKTGTEQYMAPEVWLGHHYNFNVDMYSLGIVMYRFLNQSRTPFLPDPPHPITPHDRDEALRRRMQGEPIPPIRRLSSQLNAILLKACSFDPRLRYPNPAAMRADLEAVPLSNMSTPVFSQAQASPRPFVAQSDDRTGIMFDAASARGFPARLSNDDEIAIMLQTAKGSYASPDYLVK